MYSPSDKLSNLYGVDADQLTEEVAPLFPFLLHLFLFGGQRIIVQVWHVRHSPTRQPTEGEPKKKGISTTYNPHRHRPVSRFRSPLVIYFCLCMSYDGLI